MFLPVILIIGVYVYSELKCYARGGDVYQWTVKLANWLKG